MIHFFSIIGKRFVLGFLPVILVCCSVPKTSLHHSSQFSNLRTEITLNSGAKFVGYTTYRAGIDNVMQVYNPSTRTTTNLSLNEINKLEIEEEAFFIKWIEPPVQSHKHGGSGKKLVVLRQLVTKQPEMYVYEYKYPVKHPKSPVDKIETAFYVQFGQDASGPLTQFGTSAFTERWNLNLREQGAVSDQSAGISKPPKSLKALLKYSRIIGPDKDDFSADLAE